MNIEDYREYCLSLGTDIEEIILLDFKTHSL